MNIVSLSREGAKAAPLAETSIRTAPPGFELHCPKCSACVLAPSAGGEHSIICPECKAVVLSGNGRSEFVQSCLIGSGSILAAIGLQTFWVIAALGFSLMLIGFLKRF